VQSFQWDSNYVTGIDEVDSQHMRLVETINALGTLLAKPGGARVEAFKAVLGELSAYAQFHFAEEERLMRDVGVDQRHLAYQQHEHQSFIDETARIAENQSVMESADRLMKFLIHWLAYHILGSDQSMARQILLIRQGLEPEQAWLEDRQTDRRATEPLLVALDALFHQVSERNRELYELNASLEAKVAERTHELAIANEHLEALSHTDVLTELPNRRHALSQLKVLWDRSEALSCMMIDADGFKQVNDNYGHDAGDVVLTMLAKTLVHSVRNDDVVCRLGGDEFLIICPHTPLQGALHVAENTRKTVDRLRVTAGAGEWKGSISVGVAERTAGMRSPDELIKAADEGVYLAKKRGRNCVASATV